MMAPHEVRVDEIGQVMLLTIDRPERRNAIDRATADQIERAIDALDSDPALRVGVITGANGTFCAGMDLKAFARGELGWTERRGFAGIATNPPRKPVVAAIEGHAVGGGLELALACDLLVASRDARFGIPEVRRGLVAGGGGLFRLPERVPYHVAMELALTGDLVPAEQLARWGLLNRVVEPGSALAEAVELATSIAANAPLAVGVSKQVIVESRGWSPSERFDRQRPMVERVRQSRDALEGAQAFAEHRAPVWRGE
jgi:enoyl-CoA hydratase